MRFLKTRNKGNLISKVSDQNMRNWKLYHKNPHTLPLTIQILDISHPDRIETIRWLSCSNCAAIMFLLFSSIPKINESTQWSSPENLRKCCRKCKRACKERVFCPHSWQRSCSEILQLCNINFNQFKLNIMPVLVHFPATGKLIRKDVYDIRW